MRKFVSKILSCVMIFGGFALATQIEISDKKTLFDFRNKDKNFICYKHLEPILNGENEVKLSTSGWENSRTQTQLDLDNLKQDELFDEFKIAKEIVQKLDSKNDEIKKILKDRYQKMRTTAFKMGCVGEEKVSIKDNYGFYVEHIEKATFDYTLKEVYETILKELDSTK